MELDLKTDLYLQLVASRGGLPAAEREKFISRHECNESLDPVPLIAVL